VKIFQRGQRSLFGEILDWMLTPLLLLVPVSIGLTWLVAQGIANAPFDRALEYNVRTLARLVTVDDDRVQFYLPQPAREILRADDTDKVYFQVREIARQHRATVLLEDARPGVNPPGARFSVRFDTAKP
jgi:two-component system sensor histidine kinase TctE